MDKNVKRTVYDYVMCMLQHGRNEMQIMAVAGATRWDSCRSEIMSILRKELQ